MVRERLKNVQRPPEEASEIGFVRETDPQMKQFFDQVNEIKRDISKIAANSERVNKLYSEALAAARNADVAARTAEIDEIVSETNKTASIIRRKLQEMQTANKELEQKEKADKNYKGPSAEMRTRTFQHGALTKMFVDAMSVYQQVQEANKAKFRARTEREIKIVDPNATPEQIEEAIEHGTGAIFAQQIERMSQTAEAQQLLKDIQSRHEDIVKLEESLKELRQLFLDMQALVEAQGEVLNEIENAVSSAVDHTAAGVTEMRKAVKYQKAARKKMLILCCCVIILILAIVLPLAITLSGK